MGQAAELKAGRKHARRPAGRGHGPTVSVVLLTCNRAALLTATGAWLTRRQCNAITRKLNPRPRERPGLRTPLECHNES